MNYGADMGSMPPPNLYRSGPSFQKVPDYQNMFAENPHHPSYSYKFSQSYLPLPGRQPLYFPPTTLVKSGRGDKNVDIKVAGSDRYKFFKRPLVANFELETPDVVGSLYRGTDNGGDYVHSQYSQANHNKQHVTYNSSIPSQSLEPERDEDYQGYVRDAWTQSDYRENEVQTEPFTPEYVLSSDESNPEVLAMTEITFNDGRNGGHIGMEELKIIDRVRRRRRVEAELPMGTDKEAFDQRVKMLKKLEMQEWNEREQEITQEQNERLDMIRTILENRELEKELQNKKRIEDRRQQIEQDVNRKMAKFEKRRQKHIRKITKKFDNPEMRLNKRDVLQEYTFFGSKTYAPPPREGRITDLNPIAYEIRPALLTDPMGIEQVEQRQISKMMDQGTQIDKPLLNQKPVNSKERKVLEIHKHIENARRQVEIEKNQIDLRAEKLQQLHDIYKAPPKVVRPPTPQLYDSDDENDQEEESHNSAILLQRLLRGRAVQCEFDEGKERSLSLIRELQGVEEAKDKERIVRGKQEESPVQTQGREQEKNYKGTEMVSTTHLSSVIDAIQGKLVSSALDYLAKELIRAREMKKIHSWAQEAEEERYRREQEELERRRAEELERKEREERFNLTIGTYHETSEAYLYDIMNEAVLSHAREKAMKKVQELSERTRERTKEMDDEAEIREVVALFLIPHVQRDLLRKKAELEQAKVVKAVHDILTNTKYSLM